jgi:hypothetical protein
MSYPPPHFPRIPISLSGRTTRDKRPGPAITHHLHHHGVRSAIYELVDPSKPPDHIHSLSIPRIVNALIIIHCSSLSRHASHERCARSRGCTFLSTNGGELHLKKAPVFIAMGVSDGGMLLEQRKGEQYWLRYAILLE